MATTKEEGDVKPTIEAARATSDGEGSEMAERSLLSPGFRSVAALAGWDEESLLIATLIVEDTPVRESRHGKRRTTPNSSNSNRKKRSRRQNSTPVPAIVLSLEDDEEDDSKKPVKDTDVRSDKADDGGGGGGGGEELEAKDGRERSPEGKSSSNVAVPCMDRLREELSCAICLEICFEPSSTPCGHSFCMRCLKDASYKCGKRCPKCRQLISNGRSYTVNTVLWNTIQLLFPGEVESRRKNSAKASSPPPHTAAPPPPPSHAERSSATASVRSSARRVGRVPRTSAHRGISLSSGGGRGGAPPSQSEDAALALRLQREEFMEAFVGSSEEDSGRGGGDVGGGGGGRRSFRAAAASSSSGRSVHHVRRRIPSYRFPYIIG